MRARLRPCRCVDHLINLIVRTVEIAAKGKRDKKISAQEMNSFARQAVAAGGNLIAAKEPKESPSAKSQMPTTAPKKYDDGGHDLNKRM